MRFTISNSEMISQLNVLSEVMKFRTSADVVMKASGLRYEAICAIAREFGVKIEDPTSRCIDENLLAELCKAHIRQLRCWFNNSIRHLQELSGAELQTLAEFSDSFKEHQADKSTELSWDAIDIGLISEQFEHRVHELTTESELADMPFLRYLSLEITVGSPCIKNYNHAEVIAEQRNVVTCKILGNRWFYIKPVKEHCPDSDRRQETRRVTLSARYHIYSDSGDEYHIAC